MILGDIRSSLPKTKNLNSSIWVRVVVRRLSFYITMIFIRLNWRADHVTYLSILVTIGGCTLLSSGNHVMSIWGAVLINIWLLLDCADGNIARYYGLRNPMGEFIDAVGGYITVGLVFVSVAIGADLSESMMGMGLRREHLIILGGLTSIFDLLSRIINQKYETMTERNGIQRGGRQSSRLEFIAHRLDKNIGISGFFLPSLLLSIIFYSSGWLVLFYFLYETLVLLAVVLIRLSQAHSVGSRNGIV